MIENFTTAALRARQEMDELAALAPRLQGQAGPAGVPPGQPPAAAGLVPGGGPPGGVQAPPGGPAGGEMPPGGMMAPQQAPQPPQQPPAGPPDPALRQRMLELQNPMAALTARYLGGANGQP